MIGSLLNNIKNSKHLFLFIWILIICSFLLFFYTDKKVTERKEEENGVSLDMEFNGNGNIYVKDGVIVSLQNIYHDVDYIALRIAVKNNTDKPVTISAEIEELGVEIEFAAMDEACEYVMMGNSLVSKYDLNIEVYQVEKILAQGTIKVSPDKENAHILENEDVIELSKDLEVYYLGLDESAQFFKIKNKTNAEKNVHFQGDTFEFNVNVKNGPYQYVYVTGMNNINITMDAFQIIMKEAVEEKEEITSEEAMYPE